MGTYLPGIGTLEWGAGVGLGLLTPDIILSNFYPPHMGVDQPGRICAPPTSLDGCGFFNSVVVRLPFTWISDGFE